MKMNRSLQHILAAHSNESEQHRAEHNLASMPLDALRDAKQLTQMQMAQLLKVSQGAVSKVERRTDMFVSTLRNYVRAIGGDLQIRAVFPDGDILIDQFRDLNPPQDNRASDADRRGDEACPEDAPAI